MSVIENLKSQEHPQLVKHRESVSVWCSTTNRTSIPQTLPLGMGAERRDREEHSNTASSERTATLKSSEQLWLLTHDRDSSSMGEGRALEVPPQIDKLLTVGSSRGGWINGRICPCSHRQHDWAQ